MLAVIVSPLLVETISSVTPFATGDKEPEEAFPAYNHSRNYCMSSPVCPSSPPAELQELRRAIDEIDRTILSLICKRRGCSNKVGEVKKSAGVAALRDAEREYEILTRLSHEGLAQGIPPSLTQTIFSALIADSLSRQEQDLLRSSPDAPSLACNRVGFLTRDGVWGEQAAASSAALHEQTSPSPQAHLIRWNSLTEAAESLERGDADVLMLPIEHSTLGTLRESVIALLESGLTVVREVRVPVSLALMAPRGVSFNQIRRLYGSELAFRLCTSLLETLGSTHQEIAPFPEQIASRQPNSDITDWAIVAPEHVGLSLGLTALATAVSDSPVTSLRFFACSYHPEPTNVKLPYATSLIAVTNQSSGALSAILDIFRGKNIVLTKLESLGSSFTLPIRQRLIQPRRSDLTTDANLTTNVASSSPNPTTDTEYFLIECLGSHSEPPLRDALEELTSIQSLAQVLGSYPRASLPPVLFRPELSIAEPQASSRGRRADVGE